MLPHEQWARRWELADLKSATTGKSYLIASNSVRDRVAKELALPMIPGTDAIPADAETLVVAGGGSFIDPVKIFRKDQWPALVLIAIPSLWGSGAEVSPVAVVTGAVKEIHFSDDLIPDHYVVWPDLAESVSQEVLRYACGDVWAHAFEAFCSPLATPEIRHQSAELMNEIAEYPLGYDPRWFDASGSACLLQARSSVGLIHGFAHVLEPELRTIDPRSNLGHARLCSTFLLPVIEFNLSRSPKVQNLADEFRLDLVKLKSVASNLFAREAYDSALAVAVEHWDLIARDRCSRTNCVLVRRDSIEFFRQFRDAGVSA